METESKFWRVLNRINSLFLLLLLLIGLVGSWLLVTTLFDKPKTRDRPEIAVEVDSELESAVKGWFLGRSTLLAGTNYVRIPLQSEPVDTSRRLASGGYYSARGAVRNYLFTNSVTNSSFWLFSTNSQVVLQTTPLQDEGEEQMLGTMYVVVRRDTSGRNDLDEKDLKEIGFSGLPAKPIRFWLRV